MLRARYLGPITVALTALLVAARLVLGGPAAAADPGAMDAMSIDMEIAGNTATSLGPWDQCVVTSPGDTITIDVTATNIPASNPMIAFEYRLVFPAGAITVESADPNFLLAAKPGSSLFNLSDSTPDSDGEWNGAVLDLAVTLPSGSGALQRLSISVAPGAGTGLYPLGLLDAYHIDLKNEVHYANAIKNAFVAVNTTCENLPTPAPTASPAPPSPPAPNDNFTEAFLIDGLPFGDVVSTDSASTEPNEPSPCGPAGATVWYAFTPVEDTVLVARTTGSDFDTILAAYTGDSLSGLNVVVCNDDSGFGLQSAIMLNAPAGETVYFQAGGYQVATGNLAFYVEDASPPTPTSTPTPTPTSGPTPPPVPCQPGGPSPTPALGIDHDLGTADINAGPAYVPGGGVADVCLVLTSPDPVGAYEVDVHYDPFVVQALGCGSISAGICNLIAIDTVRFVGASVSGLSGSLALGSIRFAGVGAPGQCSDLTIQVRTFVDPTGSDMPPPAVSNGRVCVSEGPLPTPTPPVTPTPGPTTPAPGSTTPAPGSTTPAPSSVPGGPPPFDPGGVICFEYLESAAECDGDSSPAAASDIRTKLCVGWNDDCTVRDFIVNDSNFGGLVSFTPPEWYLPKGDTIPIGALAGRLQSEVWLGLLNNPCNSRVQVSSSLLNAGINTADTISPRPEGQTDVMQPLAQDVSPANGLPDGADRYPAYLNDFLAGAQPRARLFGITHTLGGWVTVNIVFFEPGVTMNVGSNVIAFDPALGYPAILILQDPTAQAGPSVISDFCAPQSAQFIVLGKTLDNPCTPASVPGANCPVTGDFPPEFMSSNGEPYPSFPCDPRSRVDDDNDGKINDGCPRVNATAESGAQCDNDVSDDPEDSTVNDGCPIFGEMSEGARIPGACSGGDEGGCTYRSNPASTGTATFTTMALSQRDADGDGIENVLDVCFDKPNGEWNPRAMDPINDSDFDGLPNVCDPNPSQTGPGSPNGCRSGYTGADEDQDCFSNRLDNCPTVVSLLDPSLPPYSFPTGGIWNPPFAPDSDSDGIGDACDPDPDAPNGQYIGFCMKFAVNVGGASGPVPAVRDPRLAPDCASAPVPLPSPVPAPSATPTPTPTPGPPIDIDVDIHGTGSVVPRDGRARVHGAVECDRPALVELEVEVVQRAGRAFIVGVAETSVWCDGRAQWSAEAVGNGRLVGGWVTVRVHAEAQAGMSYGSDDESVRVRLTGQRPEIP